MLIPAINASMNLLLNYLKENVFTCTSQLKSRHIYAVCKKREREKKSTVLKFSLREGFAWNPALLMFYLAQSSICGKERNFLFNNSSQISSKDCPGSDPVDTGVSLLGCHTSWWTGMMKIDGLKFSFSGPK
jgi:hypothetical protein